MRLYRASTRCSPKLQDPKLFSLVVTVVSRQLENISVLVLDDHRFMQQILRAMLLGLGIRKIVIASGLQEAAHQIAIERFDLIIADFRLEGEPTGAEFIKLVRESSVLTDRFVPIIACTADTTPSVIQQLRDAGVDEIVAKPLSAEALWRRVAAVVNNRRSFIATSHFFGPDRRRRDARHQEAERRNSSRDVQV